MNWFEAASPAAADNGFVPGLTDAPRYLAGCALFLLADGNKQQLPAGKATHANANNRGVRPAALRTMPSVIEMETNPVAVGSAQATEQPQGPQSDYSGDGGFTSRGSTVRPEMRSPEDDRPGLLQDLGDTCYVCGELCGFVPQVRESGLPNIGYQRAR